MSRARVAGSTSQYKSAVFRRDYAKKLDKKGTKQLEEDFNALQDQLAQLKTQNEGAEAGDNDVTSPQKWGSASKEETFRQRKLKSQSRKILGKTVDLNSFQSVRVLKPTPPPPKPEPPRKSPQKTRRRRAGGSARRTPEQSHSRESSRPLSRAERREQVPKFAIISVNVEGMLYEFETNDSGFVDLKEMQRFTPQAVGLCYLSDDRKTHVLPVTPDGSQIRPPRGSMGWATATEYRPLLPHYIKVPMTPREKTPEKPAIVEKRSNSILDGEYDEERNQREFQEAVMAWRNAGKAGGAESGKSGDNGIVRPASRVETASIQTKAPEIELNFASHMSMLDKIYLEKMRKAKADGRLDEAFAGEIQADVLKIEEPSKRDPIVEERLTEIARERQEIREMFTTVKENDVMLGSEVDFDESLSQRTLTPERSRPSTALTAINENDPETQPKSSSTVSLSNIASLPLDVEALEVQSKYKQTQKRPFTGGPRSRPSSALSRPVTPGGSWSVRSAQEQISKMVDIGSNIDWKHRRSTWDPTQTALHDTENSAFNQLSREIQQNMPNSLISSMEANMLRSMASPEAPYAIDSDLCSRPSTAASTIIDPVEMENIERAFMLHDEEY